MFTTADIISLVLFSLVCFSTTHAVTLSPNVSVVVKTVGSRFEINCTSTNSITWTSTTAGAMPSTTPTGTVSGNENISTLTFDNIQLNNEATFRCQDSQGQDVTFQLIVFSALTDEKEFGSGGDAVLGCRVSHPTKTLTYTYSWLKNGVPVQDLKRPGDTWDYNQFPSGSLRLMNPDRKLSGLWTCRFSFTDNGATQSGDVQVNYWAAPYIIPSGTESVNLAVGGKLQVECNVLGHPQPTISWFKGNKVLQANDHYRFEPGDANNGDPIRHAKLVIQSMNLNDTGVYTCNAISSRYSDPALQVFLVQVDTERDEDGLSPGAIAGIVIAVVAVVVFVVIAIIVKWMMTNKVKQRE